MDSSKHVRLANRVLGGVFVAFILSAILGRMYPHNLLVQISFAVTEAGLVGGIADWFAVTALFRRPFGFPWHTALIPRNRDKLVAAVAGAVQNELLNKDSIKDKLIGVQLIDAISRWLDESGRAAFLVDWATQQLKIAWAKLEPGLLARYAARGMRVVLARETVTPHLARGMRWALTTGKADELVEHLLAELSSSVAEPRTRKTIQTHLEQYRQDNAKGWWQRFALSAAEATNTVNFPEAAVVLQKEMVALLADLADRQHPLRQWFRDRLSISAGHLEHDPAWAESIAKWQKGLAGRVEWDEALTGASGLLAGGITSEEVADWGITQAKRLLARLATDSLWREWAEEQLKTALGRFIDSEQDLAAMVVQDALGRLGDAELNDFIEDKAGDDLAWIRINGSVVGGIVGLLLFLFLRYVYNPYVVPVVRSWFL